MKNNYTHLEQVRNLLEVLRLVEEVALSEVQSARIKRMAYEYLDELLPERMTPP